MRKLSLFMLMAVGLLISGNAWGAKIAAQIGSTNYTSLDDAVEAANTLAAGGEEVIITIINQGVFIEGDCEYFPWEIKESMTIDLNGEIISYAAFEVAEGKVLTITDNVGDGRFEGGYYLFAGDGKYTFPNGFVLGSEWDTPTDCNGDAMIASYFEGKLEGCTAADQQDGTIIFSASSAEEPNCTIDGQRKNITSLNEIPSGTKSIVFDEKQDLTLKATKTLSDITINLGGNTVEMEENKQFQIDGTVIIQNGNLEGTYATSGLIQMNTDANLILENVTMKNKKSDGYTVMVSGVNNTSLTLTGSTAVRHTIYAHNGSETITIINGCTVDFTDCEFTPTNDLTLINNGTLNICGGKYQGTLNANSKVGTVHKTCEPSYINAAFQDAFFSEPVAKVNGKGSYTLSQALEIAEDGNTITLIKEVTLSSILTISKKVTLDLGEFTMTTGDKKISIDNNVTIQNGTLKNNSGKYAILANSDNAAITLGTGLSFDYPQYAVQEIKPANIIVAEGVMAQVSISTISEQVTITNAGTFTISAGTLPQLTINNDGNCTIQNATISDQITFAGSKPVVILNGKYQDATISGNASVQGGYYKLDDMAWLEDNLADGYTYTKTSDEVYLVAPESNFVAQVGDYKYTTLSAAVATIPDNVKTELIILNDCEATNITLSASKNVVLNLGNKTISNSSATTPISPIFIVEGKLEINAATQNGEFLSGFDGKKGCIIRMANNATVIVNGGKFVSNSEDGQSGENNRAIFNVGGGNLTINNGVFIGSPLNTYQGSIIEAVGNQTNITINKGTFSAISEKSASESQALIYFGPNAESGSTLKIVDGTFTINRKTKAYSGNGNFTCVEVVGRYNSLLISGGTFENATPKQLIYNPDPENDKTGYNNALVVFNDFKNVSIKNAAFKSYGKAAWIFAQNTGLEQCDIQDATFISENHWALDLGLHKAGQKVTIAGGSYQGEDGIHIAGNKDLASTIEISNCNIDATRYGIAIMSTTSTAYISGGTIVGQESGISMTAKGTLNISGNATITGGEYGIYNNNAASRVAVSGGRIKATAANGIVTYNNAGTFVLTGGVYNIKPIIDDAIAGHVTLGEGLSIIDNPDQVTKALGYLWTVGKVTGEFINVNTNPGATTDWGTNTTWTDGSENNVVPTIKDDVTIPAGKNVVVGEKGHTDAVANTVTIIGTEGNQGNLRVKTGNSLTVDNLLTVGNNDSKYGQAVVEAGGRLVVGNASDQMIPNIILEDDGINGTGVMLFNPETETLGNVQATIELRTNAHKNSDGTYFWNYIGIPLKLNSGEFSTTNWEKELPSGGEFDGYSYLQTWDFTEGWVNKGFEAFEQFKGVAITNDSESGVIYRFKGTMVGNADKNMEFKPRGYNFFANSYTAPIDIETLLNELKDNGVVEAVVYMFDTENNRFADVSLGAFSGFHAPYFRVIPSMNGFFILNQKTQAAQQIMDYGDAVYNCALGNRPIFAPTHETMNFSRVHINVEANGSKDGLYLIENDEFTSEFENGYDVVKYMTEGQSNIYAQTTTGRQSELFNSNIEGTMIGFEAAANQTLYTLSFDEVQGDNFVLTDMVTGESVEMSEGNTYTFFAEAGQSNDNRFLVTRANKAPTTIGGLKSNAKAQGIYSVTGHYFGNVTEWNRLPQGVYMINGVKVIK